MRLPGWGWIVVIVADLVFFTAPVVFVIVGIGSGIGASATLDAMSAQFTADRVNLLVMSALALFPVLLLVIVIGIGRRIGRFRDTAAAVALGGGIAIFAVTVFVNLSYWPSFFPSLNYPGWPHGIEFLLGPAIAAPVAMIVGMVVGVLAARR